VKDKVSEERFQFELTEALGIGTHAETMARLSATEYAKWKALYRAKAQEADERNKPKK
jgi:hypothetical protein